MKGQEKRPRPRVTKTKELRELEQKLDLLMVNTEESFVFVDKEHRIVTYNEKFSKQYSEFFGRGITKGDSILDYANKDRVEELKIVYAKVFTGKTADMELEIHMPEKTITFLLKYKPAYNERQEIIGAFVSSKDITEVKTARSALIESEDKYRSIIENSLIAFFTCKPEAECRIIEVNKAAVEMFGYSFSEFEGLDRHKLFLDNDQAVLDHLDGNPGKEKARGELTGIRKNGQKFPCEFSSVAYRDVNGQLRVTTTLVDISDRKRAEENLRENESNLRAIFDNTSDGLMLLDREGRIKAFNHKSAENHVLYNVENLRVGQRLVDYVLEYRRDYFESMLKQVLEGATIEYDIDYDRHDGGKNWFHATLSPVWESDLITGVCIARSNISERKKVEAKLEENEKRYRYLFNNNPLPLYIFEFATLRMLECNEAALRKYGYTREEFLKLNLLEIRPEEEWPLVREMTRDEETYGKIHQHIWKHQKKNGDIMYMDITGHLIDFEGVRAGLVLANDVSEKLKSEEKTRETLERFNIVAKATNDAIYDWDLLSGKVVRSGDGLRILFGYDPDVINSDADFWMSHVHDEDREEIFSKLQQDLNNPAVNVCNGEYRFKRADGSYAYVFDKGFIIRNATGKAIRLIGATQDITHRKETEMLLKNLNEKLEKRADELTMINAELEQFAYIASHDLQEPLRMVTSFLTQLEKKYGGQLDEKAHQYINFAINGAVRMRRIILDLLEYSRVGKKSSDIVDIDLNEVMREIMLTSDSVIRELDAVIEWENLSTICADKTGIQQVFQNLVGNALKYHSTGQRPHIKVSSSESSTHWQFSVSDNGIGIEPEFFDKIFVVFQRLHNKDEYSGTGIGLAICKKIVENHGGKIYVESTPGQGSTFHFTISKSSGE